MEPNFTPAMRMSAGANWVSTEGVYTLTRQLPLTRELARLTPWRLAPVGTQLARQLAPHGAAPPALGAALLGTARSWRGIVPFTHLAREGRMTVIIGRRELLAALGGAAWPLADLRRSWRCRWLG